MAVAQLSQFLMTAHLLTPAKIHAKRCPGHAQRDDASGKPCRAQPPGHCGKAGCRHCIANALHEGVEHHLQLVT
jgi:hypothetical protein